MYHNEILIYHWVLDIGLVEFLSLDSCVDLYIILLMPSVHAICDVASTAYKIMCKNGSRHCGVFGGAARASASAARRAGAADPKKRSLDNLLPSPAHRIYVKMYTSFLMVVSSVAERSMEN